MHNDAGIDEDTDPTGALIEKTRRELRDLRADVARILEKAEKRFEELDEEYRRRFGF